MKPNWHEMLLPKVHWSVLYPAVAQEARAILWEQPPGKFLPTKTLAEMIWPEAPMYPQLAKRLYSGLSKSAAHTLSDCYVLGSPKEMYGRMTHPKMWHRPDENRRIVTADDLLRRLAEYDGDATILPGLVADARRITGHMAPSKRVLEDQF